MAYTKYSLTPANNTNAPPDGAPEGMLPSAVNDTMRDMMAQIRDCGDGIRGGTYTMTAPIITGGTMTGVALSGNTLTSPIITGATITNGTINNATVGATTASTGAFTTLTATNFNAASTFGFKNRIINGDMRIDQRNAGASVTPTVDGTLQLDRWSVGLTQASKFSVQQNGGAVTPPAGFINYLGATSLSAYSIAAGDILVINQKIEGLNVADLGWGTANAKTVTLSFQVYSSLTGTFGGSVKNSAANRSYPFSYSISTANTWTSISVTIAGDTTGTWLTTNGTGIIVNFSLGTGSTYSGTAGAWAAANYNSSTGATSVVGTSGATFYITGVQLEVGSSATGFEYVDYTTQLVMCQRYFQKYVSPHITGVCATSSAASRVGGLFPVVMRADPTTSLAGTINIFDGAGAAAISSIGVSYCTTQVIEFDFVTAASLAPYRPALLYVQTGGSLSFSAEL